MASIFKEKFFSVRGQKERIQNVGATINAAFNPFSKSKVIAHTDSKIGNKVLETVANHPYITAGVASAVITAGGATAGSSIGGASLKTAGSGSLKNIAIAGGAGFVAGSLFGSGGSAKTGDQITTTKQTTINKPDTSQTTNTTTNTINQQDQYSIIYQSPNASLRGFQDQQVPISPIISPSQSVPNQLYPSQDVTPQQTATGSGNGTNWLLIAGLVFGGYLLTKNNR